MPSQWALRLANFSVLLPSLAKAFTTRIPGMVSVSTLVTPAQARHIRRYSGTIFLRKRRENSTTKGTGISDSSVSCQFIVNIMMIMPTKVNSCTSTSWVTRSINCWIVELSPLMRLIIEPVEVVS